MVGVDVGGTHGSSVGGCGFRLAASGFAEYRSGSAGPRRSRHPATRAPQCVSCGWSCCSSVRPLPRSKAPSTTTPTCNATRSGTSFMPAAARLSIAACHSPPERSPSTGVISRSSTPIQLIGSLLITVARTGNHARWKRTDLHNLWPEIANINSSRQDQSLGEIPGEQQRRFQDYCPDYERTRGQEAIIEPRDAVKGDMARSILYMLDSYGLPLPANLQRDMLLRWHEQDPPDDKERWRNFVIEGLQGTANPHIP